VLTHKDLLTAVWGPAHAQDTQYLRVFVGQLRQKLEADPIAEVIAKRLPTIDHKLGPDIDWSVAPPSD
jgi:two-component system KDP operon response regulator KdpE